MQDTIFGQEFSFETSPATFSSHQIDSGTKFLLENVPVNGAKTILDIGCGYGAIGIVLAKMNPNSQIVMTDTDSLALALCKENILLNKLQNVRVIPTSAINTIAKFNLALSNIPWHKTKSAVPQIISVAHDSLFVGSHFYLVTNYKFKTEDQVKKVFGNVQLVATSAPYKVLRSVKN